MQGSECSAAQQEPSSELRDQRESPAAQVLSHLCVISPLLSLANICLCSACWEEVKAAARRRQELLQTAEDCHRLHQGLSDALTLIQVFVKHTSSSVRVHKHTPSYVCLCRSDRRASPMTWLKI